MEGEPSPPELRGVMARVFETTFNEIEKLGEGK
jgi:hypothetical protein